MLHQIDLSRVDLNLLVLFEAIMAERNVGRAAERLALSPSAVSHGLGRLRRLLNDPLFLRTPKGVTPTERALALADPVSEVLRQVREVLSTAQPFDPATSRRRFVIGAPDGVSAVLAPALLDRIGRLGPGIDIGLRQLLPAAGETAPARAWRQAFADLETHALDIAVIPSDEIPPRFHRWTIFEEDFVIAMRRGHPFARAPSLETYCAERHLVVSAAGDPYGFIDEVLKAQGRARRVILTVSDFMFALAMLAGGDLLCALPRRLVQLHGPRFDVIAVEPPFPTPSHRLNGVVPRSALADHGLNWLIEQLSAVSRDADPNRGRR